jgi:hypothetical protein
MGQKVFLMRDAIGICMIGLFPKNTPRMSSLGLLLQPNCALVVADTMLSSNLMLMLEQLRVLAKPNIGSIEFRGKSLIGLQSHEITNLGIICGPEESRASKFMTIFFKVLIDIPLKWRRKILKIVFRMNIHDSLYYLREENSMPSYCLIN